MRFEYDSKGKIIIKRDLYNIIVKDLRKYVGFREKRFKNDDAYKDSVVEYLNSTYPEFLTHKLRIEKLKKKGFIAMDFTEEIDNLVDILCSELYFTSKDI